MASQLPTTGIFGFDRLLKGSARAVPVGNYMFLINSITDYVPFVTPFAKTALERNQVVIYFRFGTHRVLCDDCEMPGVVVHKIRVTTGFEGVVLQCADVINSSAKGSYFVFDCLSELSMDWCSDRMLGNFVSLLFPLIIRQGGTAYFSMLRGEHSYHAMFPVSQSCQILVDISRYTHRKKNRLYVHPLKVHGRYSQVMESLHVWAKNDDFHPVKQSLWLTAISQASPLSALGRSPGHDELGFWYRIFQKAKEVHARVEAGKDTSDLVPSVPEFTQHLIRLVIAREPGRIRDLAVKYLDLGDILKIRSRMIGTGLIGGKSVGMILCRAILSKYQNGRWLDSIEPHDSYFVGSDVFHTFLVENDMWWTHQQLKNPDVFLDNIGELHEQFMEGTFPDYITNQFSQVLDYFGQSPVIVRSSSLLEDGFGNAFAGKYDSVFCVNQGSRDQRNSEFVDAVRTVYASSVSEAALKYRNERGLLHLDEQMSLLVMRVSGSTYGDAYFPQAAGVALSFNPWAWSPNIDRDAGVVRLVFGLGTRAVDRSDEDYTRVVSLSAPDRRPESEGAVRQYAQRRVDVLSLSDNCEETRQFREVVQNVNEKLHPSHRIPVDLFASKDEELERYARESQYSSDIFPWVLTFDHLLLKTPFVDELRSMLRVVQDAYGYPVDVEFALNCFEPPTDGSSNYDFQFNILQCRPLQVARGGGTVLPPLPTQLSSSHKLIQTNGPVVGPSRCTPIDRIVYVVPSAYAALKAQEQVRVARLVGKLARRSATETRSHPSVAQIAQSSPRASRPGQDTMDVNGKPDEEDDHYEAPLSLMLVGPGRWGSSMSALVPDVSLGTHFFADLVEAEMLYMAVFPNRTASIVNRSFFEGMDADGAPVNKLFDILDALDLEPQWGDVIKVVDMDTPQKCMIRADTLEQHVLCYIQPEGQDPVSD